MGLEKYDELAQRACIAEREDIVRQFEARARVLDAIQAMKDEGKALELSDEEIKMIESFRRFRLRMRRDGEVFTWQTRRPDGVQIVQETAEIVHPNER